MGFGGGDGGTMETRGTGLFLVDDIQNTGSETARPARLGDLSKGTYHLKIEGDEDLKIQQMEDGFI